jgi:hypothetical protein
MINDLTINRVRETRKKNLEEKTLVDHTKLSSIIAGLFLLVVTLFIGYIVANPSYLQVLMGIPLWVKAGALILAVLIALYDYANPLLNESILGVTLSFKAFVAFLAIVGNIIIGVIVSNPILLQPILGNALYVAYIGIILSVLISLSKLLNVASVPSSA